MGTIIAILISALVLLLFKPSWPWIATAASIGGFGFFVYAIIQLFEYLFSFKLNFPGRRQP